MARPRLILVDDHPLVREGLRAMLQGRYDVVAVLPDGEELVSAFRSHRPDVVLLDLSLPNRGGIEALNDLLAAEPEARVVIVTMHADRVLADIAFRLGALGFVPKDAPSAHLNQALRSALKGQRYLSSVVPDRPKRKPTAPPLGFGLLTSRQQEIVRLLGKGWTSEQIAARLGVSWHTISFHRRNIWKQLGIHSEWEMRRYALLVDLAEGRGGKRESVGLGASVGSGVIGGGRLGS